ncbi:MAG: SPOR domain-containing protein, partial [Thermodesulfovibrionales bacterium]
SYGAASEIGMVNRGTARVMVQVLKRDERYRRSVRYGPDGQRGPFTIQVGSFREQDNAERLRSVLMRTYEEVRVSGAIVSGDFYYRVSVGKFILRDDADGVAARLAAEGYDTLIVSLRGDG